jgi:hypothetical protein
MIYLHCLGGISFRPGRGKRQYPGKKEKRMTIQEKANGSVAGRACGLGGDQLLPWSLRSMADVRAARTGEKIGHSGRDDNSGKGAHPE